MVRDLPASAGNADSVPGPGRSPMTLESEACGPQLLSLRSETCVSHTYATHVRQLLKPELEPVLCNKRSHRNEKPISK